MDIRNQLMHLIREYKYAALILAIGLLLMLLPEKQETELNQTISETTAGPEEQLEEILNQIQGVGHVRVLLSIARGQQTIYVYDRDSTDTADSGTQRQEVVIITDGDRTQSGLVSQVLPPVYLGAVVVCQGGDSPEVRLAVVEAVCNATGLTADKISVLKMK